MEIEAIEKAIANGEIEIDILRSQTDQLWAELSQHVATLLAGAVAGPAFAFVHWPLTSACLSLVAAEIVLRLNDAKKLEADQ